MDLHKLIYDYLQSEKLMTLATRGEHMWAANLYYVVDEDLNLYFLSTKTREHCQHIYKNPEVAVGIADSSQPFAPGQKGIQLYGTAEELGLLSKIKWMTKMWNKLIATDPESEKLDPEHFTQAARSAIYKITPKKIKFFNTELWPEEQIQILELD